MTDNSVMENMADRASQICVDQNWDRGWSRAGCYLHLEVSEFIEALRGKGGSPPAEEAADVLFVLFSTCRGNDVDLSEVVKIFHKKCDDYLPEEVETRRKWNKFVDDNMGTSEESSTKGCRGFEAETFERILKMQAPRPRKKEPVKFPPFNIPKATP